MNNQPITKFYKCASKRKSYLLEQKDENFEQLKFNQEINDEQICRIQDEYRSQEKIQVKNNQINAVENHKLNKLDDPVTSNLINNQSKKRSTRNQLNKLSSINLENNENILKNSLNDVKLMRKIFEDAQFIQKSQIFIQTLHGFIDKFEFHEFYEEFCRNVKRSLQLEHENPKVQTILTLISSFLVSVKHKFSIENLKRKSYFDKKTFKKKCKVKLNLLINDENQLQNEENSNVSTDEITQFLDESQKTTKNTQNFLNYSSLSTTSSDNSLNISTNSSTRQQKIYRVFRDLLVFVINDVLIPFLNSINVNTRLNTCFLLQKLINSIDDLDLNVFARLKDKLLEKLIDKNSKIRSFAAILLQRFQENQLSLNDPVQDGLRFHLKYDSSPVVRLNCLNVILINKETLPVILQKIRDSSENLREKAFIKLSQKINFKQQLTTKDRLFLIKNGLKDRKQSIVKVFKEKVIPAWIMSYDEDLIDLLKDLDLNEIFNLDKKNDEQSEKSNDHLKLIKLFLATYFELNFDQTEVSKFHLILIDFCKSYLNDEFLIKKDYLNVETLFLWSCLTRFLKKKEEESDKEWSDSNDFKIKLKKNFNLVLKDCFKEKNKDKNLFKKISHQINHQNDENNNLITDNNLLDPNGNKPTQHHENLFDQNNNQTVNLPIIREKVAQLKDNQTINGPHIEDLIEEHEKSKEEIDHSILDLILPKFSKFINFFQEFCEQLNENFYENDEDRVRNEFKFNELVYFMQNYEIEDNSQRTIILDFIDNLLGFNENISNILNYVSTLMKYVFLKVYKGNRKEFLKYSINLLIKFENVIEQEAFERTIERVNVKDIRDLELLNANEKIEMHVLKDKLDKALNDCQYDQANLLQDKIEFIKRKSNKYAKKIQRMKNFLEYQENLAEQPAANDEIEKSSIRIDSINYIKLLQILENTIRYGNCFNSFFQNKIDQYVLPGIMSTDHEVRFWALKSLNQACFLDLNLASRFFQLYVEICIKDSTKIKNCALKGLIDKVVEHGFKVLYYQHLDKISDKDKNLNLNDKKNEKANKTSLSLDEDLNDKSQFIEFNSSELSNSLEMQQFKIQITKEFIKFLLKFTKYEDEELRFTSIVGICKLMLLGRIYSPKLLSELILLWFNSNTNQSIQQDIGTFLPIYCLEINSLANLETKLPSHLTGQQSLFECFMATVESIYCLERGQQLNSSLSVVHSNYYDKDIDVLNAIAFMLNLLEWSNHAKIAVEFCKKILDILRIEREDEFELKESFMSKYLIKSLKLFKFIPENDQEIEELRSIVQLITKEDRYYSLKKDLILKIENFYQKLIS